MIARPGQRHHYGVGRRMRPPDAARRAFPPAEGDLTRAGPLLAFSGAALFTG